MTAETAAPTTHLFRDCPLCGARVDTAAMERRLEDCPLCARTDGPPHYGGFTCRSGAPLHPGCPAKRFNAHCTCDTCW